MGKEELNMLVFQCTTTQDMTKIKTFPKDEKLLRNVFNNIRRKGG